MVQYLILTRCLMIVSEQLKKQIIIEILALLFLIGVIIYAIFAIHKSGENKVSNIDGMVIVIDDENAKTLDKYSDGKGLELPGTRYTVTNNNERDVKYDVIIVPNVHDEDTLKYIRVSSDDLYVSTLTELPRKDGGYILSSYTLKPGFTKIQLFKLWYKLDTPAEVSKLGIKFEYRLVK